MIHYDSLLQNAADIIKCNIYFITKSGRHLLQNVLSFLLKNASFTTKCDSYYKMRQLFLQNATAITKCDDYYKLQMQQDMLLLKLNHILMGLYIINKSMC